MIQHQAGNSKGNYNYNIYTYFNTNWAPHMHGNMELIYALSGEITITVNGRKEIIRKGDIALILANQIHSISSNMPSSMCIAVFSEQFVPFFSNRYKSVEGKCSVFRPTPETDALIKANLLYRDCSIMMKKACLYAVCDEYSRAVPTQERKIGDEDLICRIMKYIADHYTENITLADIARVFSYEYHYLSRLMNRSYHISFSAILNQYRVDHAVNLIKTTSDPITDIAASSGFSSIRNFNHAFKSITGTSPQNMRKDME